VTPTDSLPTAPEIHAHPLEVLSRALRSSSEFGSEAGLNLLIEHLPDNPDTGDFSPVRVALAPSPLTALELQPPVVVGYLSEPARTWGV
jgi:hypothetical protein